MREHEQWLAIAVSDLKMARFVLKSDFFTHAMYGCQQAAEKSLKGYLAFRHYPLMKTHDVIQLLNVCKIFDGDFEKLRLAASFINPYSSKFRYPTEHELPDREEAVRAVKYAQKIVRLVLKKIDAPESEQKNIFFR
jgi:HEPN domain-containing protein